MWVFSLLVLFGTAKLWGQAFDGVWEGDVDLNEKRVALSLRISRSSPPRLTVDRHVASITSDPEVRDGILSLSYSDVAGTAGEMHLSLEGGDKLAGRVIMGGRASEVSLRRIRVVAPKVRSRVEPAYSKEALAERIEGTVTIQLHVEPDGSASHIQVVQSLGYGLDEAAIRALKKWRFYPGTRDGKPVSTEAKLEFAFSLKSR